MKDTFFPKKKVLNVRGKIWVIDRPVVMGILNVTPDSFYDGGKYLKKEQLIDQAGLLVDQGACILDLGAYSSRPGAVEVPEKEEWERLGPVIQSLKEKFPHVLLSIDTFRKEIAYRSLQEGADWINDISGGLADEGIMEIAARFNAPYIGMHMRGTPGSMQQMTHYNHLMLDLLDYFLDLKKRAEKAGLKDLILDPGFGFAKTTEQNYEILEHLEGLRILEQPLLIGVSRKSMVYKSLDVSPQEALNGTTALHMAALMKGADILRVHDVKEAIESITLHDKLRGE